MSLDENIFSKIKSSFEGNNFVAPKHIWPDIKESLNNQNIDTEIKTSFDNEKNSAPKFNPIIFNISPTSIDKKVSESFEAEKNILPNSIWTNIENKMDINRVWSELSPQIKINDFSWVRFAVASLVISFISLFPPTQLKNPDFNNYTFLGDSNYKRGNLTNFYNNKAFTHNFKNHNSETSLKIDVIQSNEFNLAVHSNPNHNGTIVNSTIQNSNYSTLKSEENVQETIDHITNIRTPLHYIKTASPIMSYATSEISMTTKPNENYFRIGLIGSLNNTWINNNEMRDSFDKNSLLSSKMAFGTSLGFTADYYFNSKIGISTSYFFNSSIRNKIGFYENGFYKVKMTEINYSKIALLFNYILPVNSKKEQQKYIVSAGPYFALNKNSMTISDEIITTFNSTFKKIDYGLRLKIGKEHQRSNFILSYGINSEVGLNNIIKNQNSPTSDVNYTSNFNVGVFAGVKYQLH